jgi:uncharacterized membrane protein/protein-disulfide isomerase
MTSKARLLILGFAILGLAFASASAYVHYRLITDPSYVSPCDVSSTFNCTQAYLSRFGSIAGVPIALGGVIWFALVALVAGFAKPGPKEDSGPAATYIFAMSTVGLAVVLYLGYASYFILKTLCLLCLGTYVSVVGIFVVSGLASSVTMTRLPTHLLRDLRRVAAQPLLLVIALLFIAGAASVVAFFPREGAIRAVQPQALPADYEKQFTEAWNQQPRVDLGVPAGTAKVVIVKFNDYLCPSCKMMQTAYQPVLDKYSKSNPGAVKLVMKDWPWNSSCNFTVPKTYPGHELACQAAAAGRMANDRGKGDAMADLLFDAQERLIEMGKRDTGGPEAIKSMTTQLLGPLDFDKEYQSKLADIRQDVANGVSLGIHQTPTYYVNGVLVTTDNGSVQPSMLDLAIKIELAKK